MQKRVYEIDQQRIDRQQELRLLQGLDEFCGSVKNAVVNANFLVKQKILQLVVDRIIIDAQQITIQHIVPTGTFRLQTEPHLGKKGY